MSFYGDIKRVQSSPYVFDKIYPTRKAMDDAATTDGVYVGRYVLVKYSSDGQGQYFTKYVKPDNTPSQSVYIGYSQNATTDITQYGDTFDGTVWQKIYTATASGNDPKEKYILIAELNASVPRMELSIISPKKKQNNVESWNAPSINPTASSEDAFVLNMPDTLKLNIPADLSEDAYAKSLINPSQREVTDHDNELLNEEYNRITWINQKATRNSAGAITSLSDLTGNGNIDAQKLDIKFQAFGKIIRDLYDILYGLPYGGGSGPRPFYTENLQQIINGYDKGLVGILTSIATDAKGDASKDLYARSLQPGLYYYFTTAWNDATENPDNFIENIPEVIGSSAEKQGGKCHYKINYDNTYATFATQSNSTYLV